MSDESGACGVKFGSAWLRSAESAILLVPSVIVPDEHAALINPKHPDAKGIAARLFVRSTTVDFS